MILRRDLSAVKDAVVELNAHAENRISTVSLDIIKRK